MPRGLARLSVAQIEREIRRRGRAVGRLQRRRDKLAARIASLDDQIQAAGGSVNGRAGRRGSSGGRPFKNKLTLTEALAKAVGSRTMGVEEAIAAVKRAGYRTASSNFRTQVNIALIKGPFKRVGRGQYAAR
ncbi:MAG: hypothetical protein WD749_11630 [Phycisphaerales bacterium]